MDGAASAVTQPHEERLAVYSQQKEKKKTCTLADNMANALPFTASRTFKKYKEELAS